jgi:hypothetical protein
MAAAQECDYESVHGQKLLRLEFSKMLRSAIICREEVRAYACASVSGQDAEFQPSRLSRSISGLTAALGAVASFPWRVTAYFDLA